MKFVAKILTSTFLLLLVQIGFANTTETNGEKSENKVDKLAFQQQTGKQGDQQEKLDQDLTNIPAEIEEQMDQDSLEDDSVSKYNFIFHFLYKFKYDHEEAL